MALDELFHFGRKMDLPTLRSDGLATDYTAADGCHCNNSVDCLGGPQIYGFVAHGAHSCQLGRFQPLPGDVGPGDTLLFAIGGI